VDGSELLQIFRVSAGGPLWAQGAFAVVWVAAYALWAGVYFRAVDPALRRALGGWAREPVHWVLRRGRQGGGDRYLAPRYDTWTWGLAPRDDRPLVADAGLYALSVVTVYVVAALWPVAVLYGVAFHLRLLSPPFVLVLFFLVIPLYMRFWSDRWHAAPRHDVGGPMHHAGVTHRDVEARRP
jgi:hypothetical protein